MRSKIPTIIGLKPPTKEMVIIRAKGPDGQLTNHYDLLIFDAEFPEGTQRGKYLSDNFSELRSLREWIRFTDPEVMEMFGMDLVKFAKAHKAKGDKK